MSKQGYNPEDYEWKLTIKPGQKGGPGSGHWGHAGRPGQVGGSVSGSVAMSIRTGRTARERQEAAAAGRDGIQAQDVEVLGFATEPSPKAISRAWSETEKAIRDVAYRLDMEPEELTREIEEKLKQDLQSPVSIRRGLRGARGILEDGRFKTQFETRTSGGGFAPTARKNGEQFGLGYSKDTPGPERPVYGYVATPERTAARHYGAIEFQLGDHVKKRTTITLGDSLDKFMSKRLVGTPIERPGREGWDHNFEQYYHRGTRDSYIETQIQRGVSLRDVSRIIVHSELPEYKDIVRLAQEKGIEVMIDATTP